MKKTLKALKKGKKRAVKKAIKQIKGKKLASLFKKAVKRIKKC